MSDNADKDKLSYNYELLYEKSPLGYQSLDINGCFIIVNPTWCRLLGYNKEEVVGKWFGDLLTPDSQKKALTHFSDFKAKGTICGIEYDMISKNDSILHVSFDGRIDYDEQGNFLQTHCIIQDLTEIKKNAATEKSYRYLIENSLNEIYVFDAESYTFIQINRGACENLGYTKEELLQLTPLDIKPEFNSNKFIRLLEPLISGKQEIIQFETVHQRKNGSIYPIEVHLQLSTYIDRPAFVAIILDISQRVEIENQLNLVIKGSNLGYWDWHYKTGKHYVNDRWREILGLELSDLNDDEMDWYSRVHPEDKDRVRKVIDQSIALKQPYTVEFRMRHKLQHWVWIQGSGSVVSYDTDNRTPVRLCGTHQDISERKLNDQKIRKLSHAVEQSPSLVVITDTEGNIEYVNSKIFEITGYTAEEVIGRNTHIFRSGETSNELYKVLWNTIKSGNTWRGTISNRKKNGDQYWSLESIAPLKDENSNITHFIAIQEDITEAKKISQQLNYQATHDYLTGLINRIEFENRVNRTIGTRKQNQSEHVLCYLDLDQFKIINDSCTHVAGDELLRQFANILTATFRYRDSIARLGGDEFAVLLEHCSLNQAETIAQQLLDVVNKFQFHWNDKRFRIGVSIGIVEISADVSDMSTVLSRADIACYAAKHAGRNCIHVYRDNDTDITADHQELHWVSRINEALNEDQFVLYAQPICSITADDECPDHYEVLIRLKDQDKDIIPPGAFLPAVERFNLSLQFDQWVIGTTFAWINKVVKQQVSPPCLSLNLSGQNLGNKRLLEFIKNLLKTYPHVDTSKLCFEITETAAINNLTTAREFIFELKHNGFKFSLDDFGSGLSSFDYLKNLPVDFLKIDGQFVKNIENDAIDLALVKSINDIGHVMGKKTIAEFVENATILKQLTDLKVDYVQGYYLGKPQPLETCLNC